ncbi:MAG: carbohydrate binding domain-containing protein [Candidatus Poribacteria bacterium]
MDKYNLLALIFIIILACNISAQEINMLKNGNFEVDSNGDGMADYWQYAGDNGVVATWSRDKGFKEQSSQKVTCASFTYLSPASHVMLCQLNTIQLEKGKWYKISFSAKQEGINGRAVQIAISDTKSWSNCGLQESFRVFLDWRQYSFVFQAPQTITDNTRLQFWYNTTGTFWLDDVKLENSEPVKRVYTEVLPATNAVNLLPNSSFECGTGGWGSIADFPGWGGNMNQLVGEIDPSTAKFHKSSFRIALNPENLPIYYFDYFQLSHISVKSPLLANKGWIMANSGESYTLSAYMKADRDGLIGVLSIRQAFQRTLRKEVHLTTEWERHSFTFQPQTDQIFVALGLDLEASKQEKGTVWIDGVQLEKNVEATAYQPRSMIEVGLKTDRPGNLFAYGTKPEMKATLFNADNMAHSVTLKWQTTDFDDAVVHESTTKVDLPQETSLEIPIDTGVQKKGFYRLHIQINDKLELDRSMRFAIIEPYTETDSLFGMNHAYPWRHLLDLSKEFGLLWFRDWSLKWQDVESEKGKFDFRETDIQINRVLESGLNVLPLLPFPSSNWSSSSEQAITDRYPGNRERMAYMPKDLNEFADYVRTTVGHYKDRLHVWEILNEPIYTDYALPRAKGYKVEDYVRLLQTAYQAVKEADPKAFVIGGIAGGAESYTGQFIELGGLKFVDALNIHIYPGVTAPDEYDKSFSQLRIKMRESQADKPIWFTEGAYYADDDTPVSPYSSWLKPLDSELEASEWQIKFNTIILAYGVEKIIYHSGTPGSLNNESLDGIFFEWAGAPRKMLVTQSAMSNLLKPPISSLGRLDSPEKVKAYGFKTDGQTVVVAWAEEGAKVEISLTEKWQAIDIQGHELKTDKLTLTERPVYFISKEAIKRFP